MQALGEGAYVGQRYDGERQLFLILKSQTDDVAQIAVNNAPVATPSGGVVPFSHVVQMQKTLAPSGTYRLDRPPHLRDQLPAAARHGALHRDGHDPQRYRAADPEAPAQ